MTNLSLFPDLVVDCPPTEGIKYAGSKLRLLPYILQLTHKVKPTTVLDGFAGTTRVSQALAKSGYRVIANDVAVWSRVFGLCYLKNKRERNYYQELIDHLNALPGNDGWFTEHYGGSPNDGASSKTNGLKKPFQIHNTRKLDAIREEIDRMNLDEIEKAVLLTSLILALDQVDSTLGHYASYLNDWSPRSYNTFKLTVPMIFTSEQEHQVWQGNIFDLLDHVHVDLAYFDPPYGSNNEKMPPSRVRYAAYYHLWTTVCLNDRPKLFGKAMRRADSSDMLAASVFEEFRQNDAGKFIATEAIRTLIARTNARYILLSYSSGGRATAQELDNILSEAGRVIEFVQVDYKRNVMANMRWTHEWVRENERENFEYLFLLEK
ncbi:MAG: DNA adenine methylase [Chloroflexi bacterium]|nr:DNA adenine methylase [Chloroflexota bacterium]